MPRARSRVTSYLEQASAPLLNGYAMTAAFAVYFCMYAFRKPFAAGTYTGLDFLGTEIELKTALVIAQIVGYAISKYVGIKVCPEIDRHRRALMLVALVLLAEFALVLFAIVPTNLKIVAIFLNGLPLGMVWGLVVWYLEGRQTSEILLAALSCSFIVASGIVKDVGRALLNGIAVVGTDSQFQIPAIPEFWMPAATGLIFLLPFLLAVWLLNQIPEPTEQDIKARSVRKTMTVQDRLDFVRRFLPGIVMLVLAYILLTAYRDFRDNYAVDILIELSLDGKATAISSMETVVALIVMAVMALLFFIKDNRKAMLAIFIIVGFGMLMIGVTTVLRQRDVIDGYSWLLLVGLGSYLAYVPYNSVMFDRLMASTRVTGTAVFAIYIADALGYTGSVVVQLFNDMFLGELSHLEFLEGFSYFVSLCGAALIAASGFYFLRPPAERATKNAAAFAAEVERA